MYGTLEVILSPMDEGPGMLAVQVQKAHKLKQHKIDCDAHLQSKVASHHCNRCDECGNAHCRQLLRVQQTSQLLPVA